MSRPLKSILKPFSSSSSTPSAPPYPSSSKSKSKKSTSFANPINFIRTTTKKLPINQNLNPEKPCLVLAVGDDDDNEEETPKSDGKTEPKATTSNTDNIETSDPREELDRKIIEGIKAREQLRLLRTEDFQQRKSLGQRRSTILRESMGWTSTSPERKAGDAGGKPGGQTIVSVSTPIIPRVFRGTSDEDAEEWVMEFLRAASANQWRDEQTQLLPRIRFSLEGTALKWYKTKWKEMLPDSLDEFLNEFYVAFMPVRRRLKYMSAYQDRKQREGESVESYFFDKVDLMRKADVDLDSPDAVDHVISGLLPDLARKVYDMDTRYNTTDVLFSKLKLLGEKDSYARTRMEEHSINAVNYSQPFRQTDNESEQRRPAYRGRGGFRGRGNFRGRAGRQSYGQRDGYTPPRCFLCDDPRHLRRDCPFVRQDNGRQQNNDFRNERSGNWNQGPRQQNPRQQTQQQPTTAADERRQQQPSTAATPNQPRPATSNSRSQP